MPSEARQLHPFTVVSRALRLARQFILPAVLGGASVGGGAGGVLRWGLLILAIPSLLLAAAHWLAFRYRVQGDDLIIDSGVLRRRRRVIPVRRIQNVDLEQSSLDRLAGVAELRIETASGGAEAEASLAVLAVADARSLRAELLAARRPARPGAAPELEKRTLLRLSPAELVLAGATANEAGLIAAGLATLLEVAGRVGDLAGLAGWLDQAVTRGADLGAVGVVGAIALLALVFLVLGWVLSIVATVIRFHGFTLTRVGDDLRQEHGFFSRHHTTVPLARIQAVRIEETLPRRALRRVALRIDTAGGGPRSQRGGRGGAHVPILHRHRVDPLLHQISQPGNLAGVSLHPVAPLSRRREFVRLAGLAVLLAAGLAIHGAPRAGIALVLVGPAWLLAHARYRARGWMRDRLHLVAREGVFTRTTWILPETKIQTVHCTESPFQRRWDLATLLVDTAAPGQTARVVDLHAPTAAALLDALAEPRPPWHRRPAAPILPA